MEAFALKIIREYLATLPSKHRPRTEEYLLGMFTHFLGYQKQLLLLYRGGVSHFMLNALNRAFAAEMPKDTFEELFQLYYHTGGIYNTFLLWFAQGMQKTPVEMTRAVMLTLPKGFAPGLLPKEKNTR